MLFWTSIICSFIAPFLLVGLLFITSKSDRVDRISVAALGWITVVVMCVSAVGTILTWDSR
jgi:Mn2+/Fe2+ NRAMP family transporter